MGCKNARFRIAGDGAKTYIFQAKLNGSTVRVTIGDPPTLDKAQKAARDLQQLVDDGKDPREVRAEQRTASETREAEALTMRTNVASNRMTGCGMMVACGR